MSPDPPTRSNAAPRHAPIRPASTTRTATRRLLLLAVIGGGLAAGGYAVWQSVRSHVLHAPHYQITPDNVAITPPPKWIRADIKGEAIRDAEIDGSLSVLEEDLVERVHQAFSAHPWVAEVLSVAKLPPARLEVALVYREPVCMVQVAGGLFPIDVEGVLLPTADFSPHEAARFPRFSNASLPTEPPAGVVWQDIRVLGAARLAAALKDAWEHLGLHYLELMPNPGSGGNEYQIVTRSGTRIFWGPAPSRDEASAASAKAKLEKLNQYYVERGTLDGPHGTQDIELRRGELQVVPRTALQHKR
jgi:hypothetical protein